MNIKKSQNNMPLTKIMLVEQKGLVWIRNNVAQKQEVLVAPIFNVAFSISMLYMITCEHDHLLLCDQSSRGWLRTKMLLKSCAQNSSNNNSLNR